MISTVSSSRTNEPNRKRVTGSTRELGDLGDGVGWDAEVGGVLLSIQALMLHGRGKITSNGKLGDVMKESIQAAESLVKSPAASFGFTTTLF